MVARLTLALMLLATVAFSQNQMITPFSAAAVAGAAGISFDKADSAWADNHASPNTLATTIGAGSNEYLLFGINYYNRSTTTIDSVKVDGTGGGKLDSLIASAQGSVMVKLYGRKAVQAGARTVTVYSSGNIYFGAGSISLFGVNQTTPAGTAVGALGTGTTASTSITNTGTTWVVSAVGNGSNLAYGSPGANQTERVRETGSTDGEDMVMSTKAVNGSGESWSLASGNWVMASVIINPAP